jgi:hypothetical protein
MAAASAMIAVYFMEPPLWLTGNRSLLENFIIWLNPLSKAEKRGRKRLSRVSGLEEVVDSGHSSVLQS